MDTLILALGMALARNAEPCVYVFNVDTHGTTPSNKIYAVI